MSAAEALDDDTIAFRREAPGSAPVVVVARLRGSGACWLDTLKTGTWRLLLDSESAAYAPDPRAPRIDASAGIVDFERPGAIVLMGAG